MTELQTTHQRSMLATIFVSPDEKRLRAGWRLLIQELMQIALTFILGLFIAIPSLIFHWSLELSSATGWLINEVVEFLTIVISVWVARRWLDKRSFVSLGLQLDRLAWMDLAVGIGISAVLMAAIFLVESSMGWLRVTGFAWGSVSLSSVMLQTLAFLVIFILVGFNEELMSRGYQLQTIASGTNLAWGLILSSAVFGFLHLGNPHASWISTLGIIEAGFFMGLAFIWTRRLWLSIGLHIGWDFFEGVVFGFPVSGLQTYQLVRCSVSGPTLWTGGEFGPEAGMVSILALLLGIALVFLYARGRAHA